MKVKNQKCIRRLSSRALKASRKKNIIAVTAIALTTLLFTVLFTIALSLNNSYQTYTQEVLSRNLPIWMTYEPGSTTREYRAAVDEAYDLADEAATRNENAGVRAYAIAERYSRRMAEYYNRDISINLMCPSVLICGPANFPVKKKNRQIAAM